MKGTTPSQHHTAQMAQAERKFFDKLSAAKLLEPKVKTLREAALELAVLGVAFANEFDPWTARNPFKGLRGFFDDVEASKKALASKTRVRMGAATYVSKKTLTERTRVMEDGQQFKCFASAVPASTIKADTEQEVQRLKLQLQQVQGETAKSEQEVLSLKRSLEDAQEHRASLEEINQKFHLEKLLQEYEVLTKQLRAALLGGVVADIAPPSKPSLAEPAKRQPVVTAPAAPAPMAAAPKAAASSPSAGDRAHVENVLRKVLSESTGFDEGMLTNDLNLEEDLGIDSIKRVEFVSNVSSQFGVTVGTEAMDKLARTRLVGEVVEVFVNDVFGGASSAAAPKPVAVAPKALAVAAPAASNGGMSRDAITKVLQKVLSESTGFDEAMLTSDLNLEEDLGIDSIKRVEFVSNVSGQFGVTVGAEAMDKLARTRLVGEVVDVFVNDVFGGAAAAPKAAAPVAVAAPKAAAPAASNGGMSRDAITKVLQKVLSESTGFDESMLTNDLNLEEDLGIDSIKRVEFVSNVSGQFGVTVGAEAMDKLARTRLVGEVVEVFVNDVFGGSSTAVAAPKPVAAAPVAAAAAPASSNGGLSRDAITKVLQKVLSDSTGFDEAMLTNDLNLEEDLGIDSIKRVEFVSNVSSQFGVTVGAEAMDKLARTRLVGEVVDVFVNDVFGGASSAAPKAAPKAAAPAAVSNGSLDHDAVVKVLQKVLSESTGFDESMLTNDLNLEEDLGIDSIKRVEFVSNVSSVLNITVGSEAMDRLARTRLVGEVVEIFTSL
ncbi:hypothetical protein BASA81_005612 [Batrachochytrium salamandrivorans]|nr:hypothetical protein BASA81_005612 [Batrachochytrium salamandrivorans]